eukprot:gene38016-49828_t
MKAICSPSLPLSEYVRFSHDIILLGNLKEFCEVTPMELATLRLPSLKYGTTSGLGKEAAKCLINGGEHFVVCAVRDTEKMTKVAKDEGFNPAGFNIMKCDLGSFQSTKDFVK